APAARPGTLPVHLVARSPSRRRTRPTPVAHPVVAVNRQRAGAQRRTDHRLARLAGRQAGPVSRTLSARPAHRVAGRAGGESRPRAVLAGRPTPRLGMLARP